MKKVSFGASIRSGAYTVIVTGWQLRCGAVVHRAVFASGPKGRWPAQYDDCWSVSDPVSGCAIVLQKWSMADAVAKYRHLRAAYGARFAEVLALKRQEVARKFRAGAAA
ncbi:MAG: hypothetical protein QM569_14740 [Acidovorax sp.]|uniref:hypothetical protein n=1 Tax=Acidovorax sp. TaxID=1872122 RepID=UPI0039E5D4E4